MHMSWVMVGGVENNDDTVTFPSTHAYLYPILDTRVKLRQAVVMSL